MVVDEIGRNPRAGLVAGFAAAGAGFTANLLIVGTDALLSGITTEAASIIDDAIVVTPADNWFFSIVSVFVLTIVGGLMTSRVIEPRLGEYTGDDVDVDADEEHPQRSEEHTSELQ